MEFASVALAALVHVKRQMDVASTLLMKPRKSARPIPAHVRVCLASVPMEAIIPLKRWNPSRSYRL
jgi:hypothetical protein